MKKLSIALCMNLLVICGFSQNQNPHGDNFVMDCKKCHHAEGWNIVVNELEFNHEGETGFELEGQHQAISCNDCHNDLTFEATPVNCIDCHIDVHRQSVGNDCARCHDANSWLVNNVQDLHEQNGFTLVGAHAILSCVDCHLSDNPLEWNRVGNECKDCHLDDYNNTTDPNHITAGFSDDCTFCHEPNRYQWSGDNAHFFFPLVGGHDLDDCFACHDINRQGDLYGGLSQECVSCHIDDYNATTDPNHVAANLSKACTECHNIYAWSQIDYRSHDGRHFPIYSGNHQGEWANDCRTCHTDPSNYKSFACIECHEHNDPNNLAGDHNDVNGYVFESQACYNCHPNGQAD